MQGVRFLGLAALLAVPFQWLHAEVKVPLPEGARLVSEDQASLERIYPQGAIRRISNRLRYEGMIEAHGQLHARTYELPRDVPTQESFDAARRSLLIEGAHLLYWCEGRDCGSSSLWANAVFEQSRLYGPDDDQAYALLRLGEPQLDNLVALYAITRGNRRGYLHVEEFAADAPLGERLPTPATLLRQLRETGELNLPEQIGDPTGHWAEVLAATMKMDATLRLALAGSEGEAWRDALVAQGVRATRLEVESADGEGLRLRLLR